MILKLNSFGFDKMKFSLIFLPKNTISYNISKQKQITSKQS